MAAQPGFKDEGPGMVLLTGPKGNYWVRRASIDIIECQCEQGMLIPKIAGWVGRENKVMVRRIVVSGEELYINDSLDNEKALGLVRPPKDG